MIIGAKNNKQIELWKYLHSSLNATGKLLLDTQPLNPSYGPDCESFKPMWLAWKQIGEKKEFRLGIGPELYYNEFYRSEDPNKPYGVTTIGFASEDSDPAKWVFKEDAGMFVSLAFHGLSFPYISLVIILYVC